MISVASLPYVLPRGCPVGLGSVLLWVGMHTVGREGGGDRVTVLSGSRGSRRVSFVVRGVTWGGSYCNLFTGVLFGL